MARTKTYTGATRDDAIREAARDLGCAPSEVEVAEIVTRSSAGAVESAAVEIRVNLPAGAGGPAEATLTEGFRQPRSAPPDPKSTSTHAPPATPASAAVPTGTMGESSSFPEALAPRAQAFLRELLGHMGIEARLDVDWDGENLYLDMVAEAGVGGLLIGRQGQTLDALQYLVNRVVLPGAAARGRIYLDTEGYRAKYRRKIEDLARKYRDEAIRAGQPITLEELSARDRWIIHQALQDDRSVTTRSVGDEHDRKLMIIPR